MVNHPLIASRRKTDNEKLGMRGEMVILIVRSSCVPISIFVGCPSKSCLLFWFPMIFLIGLGSETPFFRIFRRHLRLCKSQYSLNIPGCFPHDFLVSCLLSLQVSHQPSYTKVESDRRLSSHLLFFFPENYFHFLCSLYIGKRT